MKSTSNEACVTQSEQRDTIEPPSAPERDGVNDITAAIETLHAAVYDYDSEEKRKKLAKAMIASRSTIDTYGIIGNWRALAVFADDMAEAIEAVLFDGSKCIGTIPKAHRAQADGLATVWQTSRQTKFSAVIPANEEGAAR